MCLSFAHTSPLQLLPNDYLPGRFDQTIGAHGFPTGAPSRTICQSPPGFLKNSLFYKVVDCTVIGWVAMQQLTIVGSPLHTTSRASSTKP